MEFLSSLEPRGAIPSMSKEYNKSIRINNKSINNTSIMMMTLEMMRKDYKDDADIINELTNAPETVVDFDRTWNGRYEFVRCEECNGPVLGHRAEKCRKVINANKMAEIPFKQDRELELARAIPAKTSLMIGRTEIPKWIGQEFEVWKKEME